MSDCKRCDELRNSLSMVRKQNEILNKKMADFDAMKRSKEFAERQMIAAKDEAKRQRARAQDVAAELALMVIEHSVTHLDGCPEDDTCRCPHVERLNNLLNDYQVTS